jgi:hypothetical protein
MQKCLKIHGWLSDANSINYENINRLLEERVIINVGI